MTAWCNFLLLVAFTSILNVQAVKEKTLIVKFDGETSHESFGENSDSSDNSEADQDKVAQFRSESYIPLDEKDESNFVPDDIFPGLPLRKDMKYVFIRPEDAKEIGLEASHEESSGDVESPRVLLIRENGYTVRNSSRISPPRYVRGKIHDDSDYDDDISAHYPVRSGRSVVRPRIQAGSVKDKYPNQPAPKPPQSEAVAYASSPKPEGNQASRKQSSSVGAPLLPPPSQPLLPLPYGPVKLYTGPMTQGLQHMYSHSQGGPPPPRFYGPMMPPRMGPLQAVPLISQKATYNSPRLLPQLHQPQMRPLFYPQPPYRPAVRHKRFQSPMKPVSNYSPSPMILYGPPDGSGYTAPPPMPAPVHYMGPGSNFYSNKGLSVGPMSGMGYGYNTHQSQPIYGAHYGNTRPVSSGHDAKPSVPFSEQNDKYPGSSSYEEKPPVKNHHSPGSSYYESPAAYYDKKKEKAIDGSEYDTPPETSYYGNKKPPSSVPSSDYYSPGLTGYDDKPPQSGERDYYSPPHSASHGNKPGDYYSKPQHSSSYGDRPGSGPSNDYYGKPPSSGYSPYGEKPPSSEYSSYGDKPSGPSSSYYPKPQSGPSSYQSGSYDDSRPGPVSGQDYSAELSPNSGKPHSDTPDSGFYPIQGPVQSPYKPPPEYDSPPSSNYSPKKVKTHSYSYHYDHPPPKDYAPNSGYSDYQKPPYNSQEDYKSDDQSSYDRPSSHFTEDDAIGSGRPTDVKYDPVRKPVSYYGNDVPKYHKAKSNYEPVRPPPKSSLAISQLYPPLPPVKSHVSEEDDDDSKDLYDAPQPQSMNFRPYSPRLNAKKEEEQARNSPPPPSYEGPGYLILPKPKPLYDSDIKMGYESHFYQDPRDLSTDSGYQSGSLKHNPSSPHYLSSSSEDESMTSVDPPESLSSQTLEPTPPKPSKDDSNSGRVWKKAQNPHKRRKVVTYKTPETTLTSKLRYKSKYDLPQHNVYDSDDNKVAKTKLGYKDSSEEDSLSEEDSSHSNDAIPGEADKDYPVLKKIPPTDFSCYKRAPGYYADVQHRCQVYYQCDSQGLLQSFLCPVGTVFNQVTFVCDWWHNVDCTNSEKYFARNEEMYEEQKKADLQKETQSHHVDGAVVHKRPRRIPRMHNEDQDYRPRSAPRESQASSFVFNTQFMKSGGHPDHMRHNHKDYSYSSEEHQNT